MTGRQRRSQRDNSRVLGQACLELGALKTYDCPTSCAVTLRTLSGLLI
jgi:hypothetical protein